MLILRCPRCKQKMKYAPRGDIAGKSKRCVYCGRSFRIVKNIVRNA